MLKPRYRANQLICGIDSRAFSSIMIVLAFILLFLPTIVMPRVIGCGGTVLFKARAPVSMAQADRKDAILIEVQRDGRMFFRADRVNPDDLRADIREWASHGSEKKVYIRADHAAKYQAVKEVLDATRDAGVENVAFIVDSR